jgi:hypothetical protein
MDAADKNEADSAAFQGANATCDTPALCAVSPYSSSSLGNVSQLQ